MKERRSLSLTQNKEQHDVVNEMKRIHSSKKKHFWFEKMSSMEQKIYQ